MVFLLEDDASIRELVVYTLIKSGFEAKGFETPSAFWKQMQEQKPQLLILDIMLPEEDGLSVLAKLREDPETRDLPVMMLTAKDKEYDKVIGLDNGADDYMTKPFGMMELISRVRALLRRAERSQVGSILKNGKLELSEKEHWVMVDGKKITLTLKEFELLHLLMSSPGTVFTRDSILSKIWGYEFDGESRTIDVHVRTLRQKLGECGDMVQTIRGVGYKLGGDEK